MKQTDEQKQGVLSQEWEILSRARKLLQERPAKADYRLEFAKLADDYEAMLKDAKKIINISDYQSFALKKRDAEMRNLLDHMGQGLLTFGSDLLVHKQYSAECRRIFGSNISHLEVADLLWNASNREEGLKLLAELFAIEDCEGKGKWLERFPRHIQVSGQEIHVEYKVIPTAVAEEPYAIMVILTDITEKLSTQSKVEYLSYHDSLTSLYNRAYIDKFTSRLLDPSFFPLSIIMADMNGLKLTNDIFGHQIGDALLRRASLILTSSCRDEDIVARWGGDEFLLLLPRADEQQCRQVMDRISHYCLESASDPIRVSFSLGASTMLQAGERLDHAFVEAEKRMYKDKLTTTTATRKHIIEGLIDALQRRKLDHRVKSADAERLMERIASGMGVTDPEVYGQLRNLFVLHEIGRQPLLDDLLYNKERLDIREWETIRKHYDLVYRVARTINEDVLGHSLQAAHERWDGSGYPSGLRGQEIPLPARILAAVDYYFGQADRRMEAVERQSGTRLDPAIVNCMRSALPE